MDLEKQAKILPSAKTTSSSNSIDKSAQVSLFDAVRKWTDAEGVDAFDIELDGNCLTPRTDSGNCSFGALQGQTVSFQ
jgi:hypothetical protein